MNSETYHPLVNKILYGNVYKTSFDVIKNECLLDADGEVDRIWSINLDTEQYLRVAIAATVQEWVNENGGKL